MIGTINKLTNTLSHPIEYALPLGKNSIPLTPLIGQQIKMTFTGHIFCNACGKETNKSFSQGHCYPCSQKLARCDMCILKPETCHYDQGTCREPQWAENHCMQPHYIYLANTSGLKVGITRENQIPTRWIDQGATQALPMIRVKNRHLSGLVEIALAKLISDKTNWRTMLKGNAENIDLKAQADQLLPQIDAVIFQLRLTYGFDAISLCSQDETQINYPVTAFPQKITSLSFDKSQQISGKLEGIKGQYLLLDTGVINMRKFTGYEIAFESMEPA